MRDFTNRRNPILPAAYHIAATEAHVMPDGRVYVYGNCDDGEMECGGERYHVVSTDDLEHWRISDESLHRRDVPWFYDPYAPRYPGGVDWLHPTPFVDRLMQRFMEQAGGGDGSCDRIQPLLYGPDCIEREGKYYLYFGGSDDREGVCVSDSPMGPFGNPVQLPCGGIDPAVFRDRDGTVYYYWGQVHARGVPLNADLVSFDPDQVQDNLLTEEEHGFHEGISVRRIGDTYYCVYAGVKRGCPSTLCYATGPTALGPFTYRGVIIDNARCDPASWNNHGSIECIHGNWYVFYHRSSRRTQCYRRLCIEPIHVLADGSIPEVKMTSQGTGEPFGPGEILWGYQACELRGELYIDADPEYGEKLTGITDGDAAIYRYVSSESGFCGIEVKASGSGILDVFLNEVSVGSVRIRDGMPAAAELSCPPGEYELALHFRGIRGLEVFSMRLL